MIIIKVRKTKTGQKIVTIPKECNEIQCGDYIEVIKLNPNHSKVSPPIS